MQVISRSSLMVFPLEMVNVAKIWDSAFIPPTLIGRLPWIQAMTGSDFKRLSTRQRELDFHIW